MKHIVVLICSMMLAISCKSVEFQKNPPFEVVKASYNNWVGGVPGVSGSNVLIHYKTENNIVFDTIYFQSRKGTIDSYNEADKTFIIGRLTNPRPDKVIPPNTEVKPEKIIEKFPFKLNADEAVLTYTYNNKTFYYKISNIQKTDDQFFQ